MSVIGGFFGGRRERCDSAALTEISRSMHIYGGRREAFIKGRIGLSVGLDGTERDSSGLYFLERGSDVYAAVISGDARGDAGDILMTYAESGEIESRPLGELSCALCDGRGELIVFRAGEGSPPIYYGECDGDFAFASRIRGLTGFFGGCFVRLEALRTHLTSAAGRLGSEDLYVGVSQVKKNSGLRFSSQGVSRFIFKPVEEDDWNDTVCGETGGSFVCPDREGMRELLMEILMAFDHPQFDVFMPTFLRDLTSGNTVTDHTLCMDTGYAQERRERLFALCGRSAKTVPPVAQDYGECEFEEMDRVLLSILEDDKNEIYERVLGADWRGVIEKEKNIDKNKFLL